MSSVMATEPCPSASLTTKQSPVRNLLERLWLGREDVLEFLDDVAIPFDNSQAERDLRRLKVQQKISGGFRAHDGSKADAFAQIRGCHCAP